MRRSRPSSRRAGQSTTELAVLVAVIAAALLSMQIYLKRGISGRLREAADSIGSQYAPGHMTSNTTLTATSKTTTRTNLLKDQSLGDQTVDIITTTTDTDDSTTKTGRESVGALGTTL